MDRPVSCRSRNVIDNLLVRILRQETRGHVQWLIACYAGLMAGAVFILFSGGTPGTSGGQPTAMGRTIESPDEARGMTALTSVVVHLGLSLIYALIIAPIVHRLSSTLAVLVGGVCRLGLYFLNYFVAVNFFGWAPDQGEAATMITHIVFGMVAAGIYRGLSKTRVTGASWWRRGGVRFGTLLFSGQRVLESAGAPLVQWTNDR